MAIDLASNLEPVLTQMCRVSYNNNNNNVFWVDLNDFLHFQLINFFIYFFKAFDVELQRGHRGRLEQLFSWPLSLP